MCLFCVSKRNGGGEGEGEAYFEAKIEFWLSGWSLENCCIQFKGYGEGYT